MCRILVVVVSLVNENPNKAWRIFNIFLLMKEEEDEEENVLIKPKPSYNLPTSLD